MCSSWIFFLSTLLCFGIHVQGSLDRSALRISGGQPADIGKYPFATSLLSNFGSGSHWQACGGSIITPDAILSAASCFDTSGSIHPVLWWRARVGSTFSNAGGITHIIRRITQHPDYVWSTKTNDIAVLRTTLPFSYSVNVGPASLGGTALALDMHRPITAIGWRAAANGNDATELRDVEFWIVNKDICRNRYRNIGFDVGDTMFCAGWLDVGVRAQCVGDVGSPIILDGHIIGVFSWAQGCAEGWFSGINTWVSPFNNWIANTARETLL